MKARIAALTLILSAPGPMLSPAQARSPFLAAMVHTRTPSAQADTAAAPVAESTPTPAPDVVIRALPLTLPGPDNYLLTDTLTVSADSASVACLYRFGPELDNEGIMVNAKHLVTITQATQPTFTPDSKSVASVVNSGGWKLYRDGKLLDGFEPVTPVRFSPDSQRAVYVARDEARRFVVEGELAHPYTDGGQWDRMVFTPDSTVLAYPASMAGLWHMMVNGDPGPAWDRIASPIITARRGPYACYVALKHGRYHVADRHTPGPGFRLIETPPVVSADGGVIAYWAMGDDHCWRVYRNHKPVKGYDADRPGQLVMSADGQTLAAILKRGDSWLVVCNGKPGDAFAAIGKDSLTLSPEAKRLACAVQKPRGWAVVLDGVELPTFVRLAANSLRFSPDGKRFIYAALTQGQWSVIEEQPSDTTSPKPLAASHPIHPPFNHIDTDSFIFSPDSRHLAYTATVAGRKTVVFDGEILGEYTSARHLTFSPDSKHLVYVARQAGQSRLYVDGAPTNEPFDELIPGANLVFRDNIKCHTLAIRRPGPALYRLELSFKPPAVENKDSATPDPPDPAETPAPTAPGPSMVDVPTP